jgi:type IV pilus assembly protein PilA
MDDVLGIIALVAAIAALALALLFPLRLLSCLFSARMRQAVRRRWLVHVLWGLFSLAFLGFAAGSALMAPIRYTERAKVYEGYSIADPARIGVSEHWTRTGTLPGSNAEAGIAPPNDFRGSYLESVTVEDGGSILLRYQDTSAVPEEARGRTIVLVPEPVEDRLIWVCTGGDMPERLRPIHCRGGP